MPDIDGDIAAWFSRHLVTLEVAYTVRHKTKPFQETRTYINGFLLWEKHAGDEGATIWVTAGHCMRWIEEELIAKPDYYSNVGFRFVDTLHGAVVSDLPITFDYAAETIKGWLVHSDEHTVELGLDFGVIFLRPHYARQLAANRITPVAEYNWTGMPDAFDKYFMIGLPAERVKPNENGVWTARPSMVEITKLEEKPACFREQTDAMFYGVVDPGSQVRDIAGMSGGPIIGLKLGADGTGRYWFIAIQSSWYSRERIVCASPLAFVRDFVVSVMKAIFSEAALEPSSSIS
jgi:hypothetical protein